jgi:hypothetical protein
MFQATQNLIFEKYKEDKKRQAETLLQQEAKALEEEASSPEGRLEGRKRCDNPLIRVKAPPTTTTFRHIMEDAWSATRAGIAVDTTVKRGKKGFWGEAREPSGPGGLPR